MSELSRSHTGDIADIRFAAAMREAGRLACRRMSSYGMFAFDGKEDTEGLGSIWARSHPEDCQPPKTSRPLILPFKLTSVTRAL